MLARDNNFLAYVGRGGSKNETASTKMYTRDNFNMGLKKNRGMSTCYSQVFPQIDKNKISFEDKKVSNELTPNKYKIDRYLLIPLKLRFTRRSLFRVK